MLSHDYNHLRYVYSAYSDTNIIACQYKYIVYDDNCTFKGVSMSVDQKWENQVKGILKAELTRRDVTYKELVEKACCAGRYRDIREHRKQDKPR